MINVALGSNWNNDASLGDKLAGDFARHGVRIKDQFDLERVTGGRSVPQFVDCQAVVYVADSCGHDQRHRLSNLAKKAGLPLFPISRKAANLHKGLAPLLLACTPKPTARLKSKPEDRPLALVFPAPASGAEVIPIVRTSLPGVKERMTDGSLLLRLLPRGLMPASALPEGQLKEMATLFETENEELRGAIALQKKVTASLTVRAERAERELKAALLPLPNGKIPVELVEIVKGLRVAASFGALTGVEVCDILLARFDK